MPPLVFAIGLLTQRLRFVIGGTAEHMRSGTVNVRCRMQMRRSTNQAMDNASGGLWPVAA